MSFAQLRNDNKGNTGFKCMRKTCNFNSCDNQLYRLQDSSDIEFEGPKRMREKST